VPFNPALDKFIMERCRAGASPAETNWQPQRLPYKTWSWKKHTRVFASTSNHGNKLKPEISVA